MSDVAEEIRCALAMRDAGYAVLFDHETSAELLRRYDALVKALHVFLPPGQEAMEEVLWGNQPDDAPMQITIKYGQYKKAREALVSADAPVNRVVASGQES